MLGQNGAMHGESDSGEEARRALQIREWGACIFGLLVSLVVVGPTFLSEETWHGAPLIDRGGALWVIPAVVMAIGFYAGGMIAGYSQTRIRGALLRALLVAALTISLAFAGDLARRFALGEGVQLRILEYWVGAVFAAVLVGGLGGVSGSYLARKAWTRRQLRLR